MKERMKKFFNDKGFTLVELMVVVAILAALTVIAIPLFNNKTDDAKKTACDANIRTIESAMAMAEAEGVEIKSVGDLVAKKFLKEAPQCPFDEDKATKDGDYKIDENGKVKCNYNLTGAAKHPAVVKKEQPA